MGPPNYADYYEATAAVSGSLTGLLFVAIALRYDEILGPDAELWRRAVAISAFTTLVNALSVSLFALIPTGRPGIAITAVAAIALLSTVRVHMTRSGRRETRPITFYVSLAIFSIELAAGIALIVSPHSPAALTAMVWVVFAAFISALQRSWALLQPDRVEPAA